MTCRNQKSLFTLLVFLLSVSPHACIVEQSLATVTHALPAHHEGAGSEHHSNCPSHQHDQSGNEDEFCCDNPYNTYIASKQAELNSPTIQPINYPVLLGSDELTQITSHRSKYYFLHNPDLKSARARDKYALTCLLHAPPRT